MSTILVTGGKGLVGKALQQQATKLSSDKWIFVDSKDADLCDAKATHQLFETYKPTHVIHLAAYVGGLFRNLKEPITMWYKNIMMNNNVLEVAHEHNCQKVISCLSTCIFPDKIEYPITEKDIHNGPPHHSNESYAYAKRMLDVVNRAFAKEHKRCFTSIIPTNIYGPDDNFDLENSHVIPGLIHKLYLAKLKEEKEFKVVGTGQALRQFIYSLDLARLIVWAIDNYNEIEPIILAVNAQDEISIYDLTNMIAKALNYTGKIIWDNDTTKDGQLRKTADNSKLKKYLDFSFTPLEVGIKETVEWFVKSYPNIRK